MAKSSVQNAAPASAMYGIGCLGALIYFVTTATGLGGIILGILKALFWPGFLVYHLMKFLEM